MNVSEKITIVRSMCNLLSLDPSLGEYRLGQLLNINHATAGNYKRLLRTQHVSYGQALAMSDEELAILFGFGVSSKNFVEPEWDEIRSYLDEPRCWGNKLPTVTNAWQKLYVKTIFPDYIAGPLPENCMSDRTFMRKYNEYLDRNGLQHSKHSPNPNCNFGPASVMEIDTVGDKLPFQDKTGEVHYAVIFTATLKYSGYIYAEAMSANQGFNWANAIINACWYFGGCSEVIRSDNDSALAIHGNKSKHTRTVLRPAIAMVVKEFGFTQDFCPVRRPRWKGQNERTNGDLLLNLLTDEMSSEPIYAQNINELNQKIHADLIRLNSRPRKNGQLSRMTVFSRYEQSQLRPLPLVKPLARYISINRVKTDGYVTYQHKYYYAGADRRCTDIYIENQLGKRIILRDSTKLTTIAEYELDRDLASPYKYYKADQFKSEVEAIISRDLNWFKNAVSQFEGNNEGLIKAFDWVYSKLPRTKAVASRVCNFIFSFCQKYPEDLELINMACQDLVCRAYVVDIQNCFHTTFQTLLRIKKTTGHTPVFQQSPADIAEEQPVETEDDLTRGAAYYEKLLRV